MCKNRLSLMATTPKTRTPRPPIPSSSSSSSVSGTAGSTTGFPAEYYQNTTTSSALTSTSTSSALSRDSLANLRHSLPDSPSLYSFSELSAATNHFLSKRLSSSSSAWRCSLRGKDAVVVQLLLRADPSALPSRLSSLSRSHDAALVPLLGACVAADHLYLVYPFVPGASLRDCLRNPRNPNFTPLSTWISRIQVAADLAHGLDYIHHQSRTVHNRIKSSSILVTEPHFNAKICHFGAADLSGEVPEEIDNDGKDKNNNNEIEEISSSSFDSPKFRRSQSRGVRIEGTRGYMAPEVISGGRISKRSDVYAFGVVILELISGMEPIKYRFDRATKEYHRISVIETAREAIGGTEDEEGGDEAEERRGRVRMWVDGRLRDSFPVEVAERLVRVALRCVEEEPWMRPEMTWVAGKVSKMLLESAAWQERVRVPADFTVSLAPR